jgi:hypothetical protein
VATKEFNQSNEPFSDYEQNPYKNMALAVAIQAWKNNPNFDRKDEELDRRIELSAMRVKPTAPFQLRSDNAVRSPYYLRQVATVTFPGWHVVQNMLNTVTSPSTSLRNTPRLQEAIGLSITPRVAVDF